MSEKDTVIICRCGDVTQDRIRELIAMGYNSFDEIKRITRCGMGPCQGKTCMQLVLNELSRATGQPIADLKPQTTRPPVVGIPMKIIAAAAKEDELHD